MTKVTGEKEILAELARLAKKYPYEAELSLWEEAYALSANMTKRIPVDTGRLRSTAYSVFPEEQAGELIAEVGVATDYAVPVHERTEVAHTTGEAKFLENAIKERQDGYAKRLADRIRKRVDK
jgi:hypothetical protein